MDRRIIKLAKTIVNYSCEVSENDRVTIDVLGESPKALVKALIKEIYKVGAHPYVVVKDASILKEQLKGMTVEMAKEWSIYDLNRLKATDVYIMIKSVINSAELSDVPEDQMRIYTEYYLNEVNHHIVNKTKWISLRYPNNSMAQLANMSFETFEDYYFEVCNLDYLKMSKAMDHLVELMDSTDHVKITGQGTDISFSIKNMPVHKCAGIINLPDGEVYTAPVLESVNGYVQFNTPTVYNGSSHENIRLEFKDGKIINALSNNTEKLKQVFDIDDGARYIGEFALGLNPFIRKPIKDILFDEKIMGSFHLTPGFSYENAFNGNKSSIHWDLVCIQTEAFGGGEIYFDNVLIRKDGLFVLDILKVLNPENLM